MLVCVCVCDSVFLCAHMSIYVFVCMHAWSWLCACFVKCLCVCMCGVHVCVLLCMSMGQWEWWVCKRVTASGLYIVPPPSSPLLSRGSVEIPTQLSGLFKTAPDNQRTDKTTSKTALHFNTPFQWDRQRHGSVPQTEECQPTGGAGGPKAETDTWSVGLYSSPAWGPTQPVTEE